VQRDRVVKKSTKRDWSRTDLYLEAQSNYSCHCNSEEIESCPDEAGDRGTIEKASASRRRARYPGTGASGDYDLLKIIRCRHGKRCEPPEKRKSSA
jgi:hypothetical protein